MLKIGFTQATTINTARESGSYPVEVSSTTIIKKSQYGHPNLTNVGLNKKVIKLTYADVEMSEYLNHKQYCSPFVTQSFWVQLINERGITLLDSLAFLGLDNEVYNGNITKISYSLTVYEL